MLHRSARKEKDNNTLQTRFLKLANLLRPRRQTAGHASPTEKGLGHTMWITQEHVNTLFLVPVIFFAKAKQIDGIVGVPHAHVSPGACNEW